MTQSDPEGEGELCIPVICPAPDPCGLCMGLVGGPVSPVMHSRGSRREGVWAPAAPFVVTVRESFGFFSL